MKIPKLTQIPEIKILPRIKISIFLPIVAVCAYLCGYGNSFTAAYAAAILHEGAHILCAHFLKVKVSHMTLYPFGVCAKLGSGYIKSSEKEFIIAFSGPFLSLILFWLCSFLTHNHQNIAIQFFADVNLAICAVNLIPALPLDGGRMFKSLLTARYGTIRAYNFTVKFSFCSLSAVCIGLQYFADIDFSLSAPEFKSRTKGNFTHCTGRNS